MNARASRLGASMAQTLGLDLFDASQKRKAPLCDFIAGERYLRGRHPSFSLNDLVQGRGLAISLVEDAARHPDERPVRALRAAADLAERALTQACTEDDHLAAWRRMTELLDGALAEVAP